MTRLQIFICVIEAVTWVGIVFSVRASYKTRRIVREAKVEYIKSHAKLLRDIALSCECFDRKDWRYPGDEVGRPTQINHN